MSFRITPWPGSPPTREDIQAAFEAESLSATTWSNGPGDVYSAHTHSYHKVLFCVKGSIVFDVEGEKAALAPGDRLDLPAGLSHSAEVGPQGVVCMEAARY